MNKLVEIYNTGYGNCHEAGLQAVWDAAIASVTQIQAPAFTVVIDTPIEATPEVTEQPADEVPTPEPLSVVDANGEVHSIEGSAGNDTEPPAESQV